jgi:CheY-like chemotaxis protein
VSDHLIPPQILHVDDDPDALNNVRDFLQGEDIPGWGRPQVTSIESFDDALAQLEARRFDLMILDVRLGGHEGRDIAPGEEEGALTLARIKERRFLPVIFWTGLPGKVEHLRTPLVHALEKSGGLDTLIASVRELFATRLPTVNQALRRLVEDEQRRYMWDFVASHWDELRAGADEMALAYLLVRRLGRSLSGPGIHRLAAELGEGARDAPAPEKIHAAEMYLIPPLQDTQPGVADLYRERVEAEADADHWWLVVTPSCDLQWDKAEFVVLAACTAIRRDQRITNWWASDNSDNRRAVRDLVAHNTGGQHDRNLYLPAAPTIPDLIVDFQRLRSITTNELSEMERVASLVSPFAEAVVSRFTRYFGRVGTDDLDVDAIMARLKNAGPADASQGK